MAKKVQTHCAYRDCKRKLPVPKKGQSQYGMRGVSLSRADSKTIICSRCGEREAFYPQLLDTNFKGVDNG